MTEYLIWFSAVAATTAAAYLLTLRRQPGRPPITQAIAEVMECVGVFILFLLVNTAVAFGLVLATRVTSSTFVSLYIVGDITLIFVSAFQGFLFRLWWRST
jgi:hypothetical protein